MMLGCSGQPRESQRADTDRLHDRLADARIGGPCETCELMYLGIPPEIDSMDVSPGAGEPGDRLLLTGTIYAPDGVTPAAGGIVYYWQTDSRGY